MKAHSQSNAVVVENDMRKVPKEVRLKYAHLMVVLGARGTVIASCLDLPPEVTRKIYREVTGVSSPSGMNPVDHNYYFTPVRRIHSSYFMQLYKKALKDYSEVESLLMAYQIFILTVRETELTFDRAYYLSRFARADWNYITENTCSCCNTKYVVQQFEALPNYKCPVCNKRLQAARKLKLKNQAKIADVAISNPPTPLTLAA